MYNILYYFIYIISYIYYIDMLSNKLFQKTTLFNSIYIIVNVLIFTIKIY